ncbi:hypothetical protein [Halomonas sp. GT]|uniref:hypothetical protein n=1 Tax=Halomonas sp. GT TaxID=1971364 RepID=UPI0018DDB1F9|nr:hypothetical protein [Halomonas sp. GT]
MSEFAHKCGVNEEKLLAWEAGEQPITFRQAMQFAEKAYVPFGYLFLTQPPAEVLPIPDLRTLEASKRHTPKHSRHTFLQYGGRQ